MNEIPDCLRPSDRYTLKRIFSDLDKYEDLNKDYRRTWLYEWAMNAPEKKWKRYYMKIGSDENLVCIHSNCGKYFIAAARPRGFIPVRTFGARKWDEPEEAQAFLDDYAEKHGLAEAE